MWVMKETSPISLVLMALVAGPLGVEIAGYIWHRFVEHRGGLGRALTHRHWVHHEVEYPVRHLRARDYHDAGSWGWYVMMGALGCACFLLLRADMALAASTGGLAYGWVVINYFHRAFHVRGHWLLRFAWFRRRVRLHDIHHFERANYGILFFGLDRLWGTYAEEFPAAKRDLF